MSVAASPGRTWPFRVDQRGLLVLAGKAAAGLFHAGDRLAGLSGSDLPAAAEVSSLLGSEGPSGHQSERQPAGNGNVDCVVVPLPITELGSKKGQTMKSKKAFWLLLIFLAISRPLAAQVEKVVADAEGIT